MDNKILFEHRVTVGVDDEEIGRRYIVIPAGVYSIDDPLLEGFGPRLVEWGDAFPKEEPATAPADAPAETPADPLDLTVPELLAYLAEHDLTAEDVLDLYEREKEGRARKSVLRLFDELIQE